MVAALISTLFCINNLHAPLLKITTKILPLPEFLIASMLVACLYFSNLSHALEPVFFKIFGGLN